MTDTILIVDDEDGVRRTFREWLTNEPGIEVLAAADAEAALKLANQHPIDLAVLDWNLGSGSDGLQLLEDLAEFHPDVVAILITGFAHQATPLDALRMGVRDYLDKNQSLTREAFLAAVRKQLARITPIKRQRLLNKSLAEFRSAVEQVLPLIRGAAALNDPVPLPEAVKALLQFVLCATGAKDGAVIVHHVSKDGSESIAAYGPTGDALACPPGPFGRTLAAGAVSAGDVCVAANPAADGTVDLFPFEKNRSTILAAPMRVGTGVHAVLEAFDKPEFTSADRSLALAAAEIGADLLRHALAERQTHRLLADAVDAALVASRAVSDTLAPPADEPSPAVMDRLRTGLADDPAATLPADTGLKLIEAVRRLADRHGPAAVEHCIAMVRDLHRLLDAQARAGVTAHVPPMTDPRNPFDDLFALATPDRLLRDPRATGAGVAVAVIDSGIDRDALAARHPEMEPVAGVVFRGADPTPHPDRNRSSAPHGTTVADVILTIAPRVKLHSADVFGPQGECEVETVVHAVRHAVDVWKVKVVNLSLGVPEQRLQQLPKRQALYRVIEDAYFQDVLVFAAAHNDHPVTKSYPAAIAPPLLSVDKGLFDDPLGFAYRVREKVEFQAHGRAYLGPFAREPATSWAVPHLAGVAAKLLSLRPDLKPFEMKTLLYWMFRGTQVK